VESTDNNNESATSLVTLADISNQLKIIFEMDDQQHDKKDTSGKETCEKHFRQNFKRLPNGKYQVKIPFKEDNINIGESRKRAIARLIQLEEKLDMNPKLKVEYHKFLQEYLQLGHMEMSKEPTESGYFIPHHGVLKEDAITTKLRVVFDASAKTTNGKSLNETINNCPI
jgi:hypothetical protein